MVDVAQSLATVVLLHDGDETSLKTADRLAAALESRLIAHLAFQLSVRAVSTAAGPTVAEIMSQAGGVTVAVPLEPIWSRDMMRTYHSLLSEAGRSDVEIIGGWQDDERFHGAVVGRAKAALGSERFDAVAVLLAARPLPEEGGGAYHDQAQRLAARLVGMMAPGDWRLTFWSPAGDEGGRPGELTALLEWEWPTILVVPLGSVVTGADGPGLDRELAPVVEQAGRTYARAAAVFDDPGLLASLADAVVDHLARRPLPDAGA